MSPDDADPMIELDALIEAPAPVEVPAGTTVHVHLSVQVGAHRKDFDALATTDADGYRVARGLASSLNGAAGDWATEHQR